MPYGPDNGNELLFQECVPVVIPPGCAARFQFGSQAAWENAICIYRIDAGDQKDAERGNYNRSLSDWVTSKNTSHSDVTLLVSGWHKNTPPNGGEPWHQSRNKIHLKSKDSLLVGFEDSGDNDFNDIHCYVTIAKG